MKPVEPLFSFPIVDSRTDRVTGSVDFMPDGRVDVSDAEGNVVFVDDYPDVRRRAVPPPRTESVPSPPPPPPPPRPEVHLLPPLDPALEEARERGRRVYAEAVELAASDDLPLGEALRIVGERELGS